MSKDSKLMIRLLVGTAVCLNLAATAARASAPADARFVIPPAVATPLVGSASFSVEASAGSSDADLMPPPTAVYDILAHVVVLPDGTRLEAHSGLGERVDNPRHVREHMQGSTPPALYDLAVRERPFHGVIALRLKPISGDVFGRAGLLTHTYLLHGRAESNGCIVFRDYAAFLRAFRDGRVRRVRVVPSVGEAALRVASQVSAKLI